MCFANPLWGAPRIHGELLKLVSRSAKQPLPSTRCADQTRHHRPGAASYATTQRASGIAAIDMFIVPSATFRLLFVMLILAYDRRKIVRFDVTQRPTAGWLSHQTT
jgi:hypothetical protein